MKPTSKTDKILWIDCAKFIAICAVMVDHTRDILYSNPAIQLLSFFSVTVFVFLSGVTSYYSSERHSNLSYFSAVRRRLKTILIPYLAASFIYQVIQERFFDLEAYFLHLIRFDASSPFYFIAFYIQLVLIAPILIYILKWIKQKKYAIIYYVVVLCLIIVVAVLCAKYTYVAEIAGGGRYLFGGTYLFIYFAGLLFAHSDITLRKITMVVLFSGSLLLTTPHMFYAIYIWIHRGIFPFEDGVNPPGACLMLYSFFIVVIIYSLFEMICNCKNEGVYRIAAVIGRGGTYSYYIFLYHVLLLNTLEFVFKHINTDLL